MQVFDAILSITILIMTAGNATFLFNKIIKKSDKKYEAFKELTIDLYKNNSLKNRCQIRKNIRFKRKRGR